MLMQWPTDDRILPRRSVDPGVGKDLQEVLCAEAVSDLWDAFAEQLLEMANRILASLDVGSSLENR
jgi:hypothetical protein